MRVSNKKTNKLINFIVIKIKDSFIKYRNNRNKRYNINNNINRNLNNNTNKNNNLKIFILKYGKSKIKINTNKSKANCKNNITIYKNRQISTTNKKISQNSIVSQ
jgi:hypothetical protein